MRGGATGHGEGCPRAYVTGESIDGALAFIRANASRWCRAVNDVASLRALPEYAKFRDDAAQCHERFRNAMIR